MSEVSRLISFIILLDHLDCDWVLTQAPILINIYLLGASSFL